MVFLLGLMLWQIGVQATGSIEGQVSALDTNAPLVQATVTISPAAAGRDAQRTNASGTFSFRNLAPGRYTLRATHEGFIREVHEGVIVVEGGRQVTGIVLAMARVPSIIGTIYGPTGEPLAAATVQAYHLSYTTSGRRLTLVRTVLTNDFGEYRLFWLDPGDYYVSASYGELATRPPGIRVTPNLPKPDAGITTIYYPDATNTSAAQMLHPAAGIDLGSINISFKRLPRFTISGSIDGGPPDARIAFLPAGIDLASGIEYPIASSGPYFEIRGISSGSYVLAAVSDLNGRRYFSALLPINATNVDIENLVVTMRPGTNITGRITIDGGAGTDLRDLTVTLVPASDELGLTASGKTLNRNGAFTIADVPTGNYDASIAPLPPGSFVSALRFAGNDLLSGPLRVNADLLSQANQAATLEVELSFAAAIVSGHASSSAEIVLVPEARYRRRPDRYFHTTTDADGHFEIAGVPPGVYGAFAFNMIEEGFYYDQEFLVRFGDRGLNITVSKDARNDFALQVIRR